ncbi:MAG: hypothetical protein CVU88_04535 [Firmicutes bacterium HGW-Firmicutes-13]|nr:MAG: hypothetical protein CVU88_04535 [Firmicutes bacterium HGW-Firmicutes-13]
MDMPYNQYYYRESPGKKRSIKIKNRHRLFFNILLMLIMMLCFVVLIQSPIFKLDRIELSGNERVTAQEILSIINLKRGTSLWRISLPLTKNRVEELPLIESTRVKYVFPRGISITIEEKETAAIAPYQGNYLEIAQDGNILGYLEKIKDEKPLLTGINFIHPYIGQKISLEENPCIGEILKAVSSLPVQSLSIFSDFNVSNPANLVVYTMEGTEVWLGTADYEEKIRKIPEVLVEIKQKKQDPSYIDLRTAHFPSNR